MGVFLLSMTTTAVVYYGLKRMSERVAYEEDRRAEKIVVDDGEPAPKAPNAEKLNVTEGG